MAGIEIIFYFDFGSPNANLAHVVIPQIEARTGARFKYEPVLLGGLFKLSRNQSPMTAFADVPLKLAYQQLEMQRFIVKHGLTKFKPNPYFPVNTLALMRGAVAAETEGILGPYVEAMYRFMWEEPRQLDDPQILAQTLTEAKLPMERILRLSQEPAIKDRLVAIRSPPMRTAPLEARPSWSAASCSSARIASAKSKRKSWPRPQRQSDHGLADAAVRPQPLPRRFATE